MPKSSPDILCYYLIINPSHYFHSIFSFIFDHRSLINIIPLHVTVIIKFNIIVSTRFKTETYRWKLKYFCHRSVPSSALIVYLLFTRLNSMLYTLFQTCGRVTLLIANTGTPCYRQVSPRDGTFAGTVEEMLNN